MNDRQLSFMQDSSDLTLQDAELAHRNRAANLMKQLEALLFQYSDEVVEAELIRAWREVRAKLCKLNRNTLDGTMDEV